MVIGEIMIRLVSVVLLLVLGAPPEVPPRAVDDYLRQQQADADLPGLAVAVVRGTDVVHRFTAGTDGDGREVTDQTPFLLGSVAKPVTALAVLQLVDRGLVELDAPAVRYLPSFRLAAGADRITVRQLLDHTSGIPGRALRTDRFDVSLADLAEVEPAAAPGARYDYSDANYLVLGALVAEVSGRPFGTYLRDNVLAPLDMRHAATSEAEAATVGLPPGHRYYLGAPQRFDSPFNTAGVPYGYLVASLDDLTNLVSAQLRPEPGIPAAQPGLGWAESTVDGTDLDAVWKAGATPGYFAHVVLVPEQDLGVIVLSNVYSPAMDAALSSTAFNVVRVLNGVPPVEVGTDPALTVARIGLVAVGVGLLAALVWALVRRRRSRRLALAAWVAGCGLLAAGALLLPMTMGSDLAEALLWMPDLGHGIIAVAVLAVALALTRVVVTVKRTGAPR
jgi:CubicO group peptidase (beta-lactamase class C family)